jgi:hypothetical protein
MKKILSLLLALSLLLGLIGCADVGVIGGEDGDTLVIVGDEVYEFDVEDGIDFIPEESAPELTEAADTEPVIDENGWYYCAEDVALYLYTYGHLPENFITKDEARDLGWEGGSVEKYAPGYAIGGDKFGNREGLLPKQKGRQYYECDIDTDGRSSRGAKRIVFSNDGLIYYTDDHYESFTLLYGEE